MPIIDTNFKAPSFLKNGHLQTMYPYFFRKVQLESHQRIRIDTQDSDFIDIDYINMNADSLVVLTHGLEGNTDTCYIKGMAKHLSESMQCDVIAWNMRSCSGEINRHQKFYHAASSDDLNEVISFALTKKSYKNIHLVGFSLGGNLTAFYSANHGNDIFSQITSAAAFSSPIHLESSIQKLHNTSIGQMYSQNFLNTMRQKALQKHEAGLISIDPQRIRNCKNFNEFDELITAPLHGFKNAHEYYEQASASNFIHKVKIPTLIVQSKDDPFLTKKCFPLRAAKNNPNLFLEITPTGGHIGFMTIKKGLNYWSEQRAEQFFKEVA